MRVFTYLILIFGLTLQIDSALATQFLYQDYQSDAIWSVPGGWQAYSGSPITGTVQYDSGGPNKAFRLNFSSTAAGKSYTSFSPAYNLATTNEHLSFEFNIKVTRLTDDENTGWQFLLCNSIAANALHAGEMRVLSKKGTTNWQLFNGNYTANNSIPWLGLASLNSWHTLKIKFKKPVPSDNGMYSGEVEWYLDGTKLITEGYNNKTAQQLTFQYFIIEEEGTGPTNALFDNLKVYTEPITCQDLTDVGQTNDADLSSDCIVNIKDLAILAGNWLSCTNINDAGCGNVSLPDPNTFIVRQLAINNYLYESHALDSPLVITNAQNGRNYQAFHLILDKGKRYWFTSQAYTTGQMYAHMQILYGLDVDLDSADYGPNASLVDIGGVFTGTGAYYWLPPGRSTPEPNKSYVEVRFYGDGIGSAVYQNVRLYEVLDYGPYVRFKVNDPTGIKYKIVWDGLTYPRSYYSTAYFPFGIASNKWTPWIRLKDESKYYGTPTNTVGAEFVNVNGTAIQNLDIDVQFGYKPTWDGVIKSYNVTTAGDTVGLSIPGTHHTPPDFFAKACLLSDDMRKRNTNIHSLHLPFEQLKDFYVEGVHCGYSGSSYVFFNDPKLLAKEMDTMQCIGFSALSAAGAGLAGDYRKTATQYGMGRTHYVAGGDWLPFSSSTATFNQNAIKATLQTTVANLFDQIDAADPCQLDLIQFFVNQDEVWGLPFQGTDFVNGYATYLQSQNLTPADFGKSSWSEISLAYTNMWWDQSWNYIPSNRTDVYACKNFYWTRRYASWATAWTYAALTHEIQKHKSVMCVVNHGTGNWEYGYLGYMRGTELFEFVREGSVTGVLLEDWLNTVSWRKSGIQLAAYLADLSRSAGMLTGSPALSYLMPGSGSSAREEIELKCAAAVGKGVKYILPYQYGPSYGAIDAWSDNLYQAEGLAKFTQKLAKAEDVAYTGMPRPSEVAIIWSASNDIWRQTSASVYDHQLIYLALQHQQIPVDFVDEFSVDANGLNNYKVAYLASPYVRGRSLQKIRDWVQAGGHLWVDAQGGMYDEYAQQSSILIPAIGITNVSLQNSGSVNFDPQQNVPYESSLDTITYTTTGISTEVIGSKVSFSLSDSANTIIYANYLNGSPAVIEHHYGNGSVYYVGTYQGLVYSRPVARVRGTIETGYRQQERRLITDFAINSGVQRPVICSQSMVQADLLQSTNGIAIVLANWTATNNPLASINLSIKVSGAINSVESVVHGTIPFTYNAGTQTVTTALPLDLVDFVVIR